jgi:8-oxo-dGTP diphosphatase
MASHIKIASDLDEVAGNTYKSEGAPRVRQRVILAVHILLWRDGKVLLLRRANTGYMDGHYGLPAGHVEAGERALAAATRELVEECALNVEESDLNFFCVSHRHTDGEPDDRIDLFYSCTRWQGSPVNAEPEKCDEIIWVDPGALPLKVIPYIRAAIGHAEQDIISYTEVGW